MAIVLYFQYWFINLTTPCLLMNFVPVNSYTNYIDANIVLGRLQHEGVDCWLMDENTITINPIWTNAVGGIKIMVTEADAKKAVELLNQFRAEQKEQIVCPRCGSHNVELISTNRKPGNWFSVFIGLFLTDYAMQVEKLNHCFDCKHEFAPATDNDEPLK